MQKTKTLKKVKNSGRKRERKSQINKKQNHLSKLIEGGEGDGG